MQNIVRIGLLVVCACTVGCTSLLPSSSSVTPSSFETFEVALSAIEKVIPRRTTLAELTALGFDPHTSSNVTLIPYPDVLGRLVPYPGIAAGDLEPGVRDCISAQKACRAYVFHFGSEQRNREGSFWVDFLNFRRLTKVKGWRFEGLVVVNESNVLFRNFSGEPRIDRTERQSNPLGPFQPAGQSSGRSLFR